MTRIHKGVSTGLTAVALSLALAAVTAPMAVAVPSGTVACDPASPDGTATDQAIAADLNPRLQGRMRGALNSYNVSCARTIVNTVRNRGLDNHAAVIAVTTAIVESSINDLTYGDADSLGLFQQRPSAGWGTPAQVEDPVYATSSFLNHMLANFPDNSWETQPVGTVCQGVQGSAFPERYQPQSGDAQLIVDALWAPTPRLGVLQNGALTVKQGGLTAGWSPEWGGGLAKFKVSGSWIGVLTTGGELYVKEGDLNAPWVDERGGVADFELDQGAGRVGVLTTDGHAVVKDGGLKGSWTDETNGVKQLRLSGNWIGVVFNDGTVSVKEGDLLAAWTPETNNVADLRLDRASGRVGVLTKDGHAIVKDGGLAGSWTDETNGVKQLRLSGNWIGVVFNDGTASVKEGGLLAAWTPETNNVADLQLDRASGRVGVLSTDGHALVKDGGLAGSWTDQTNGVQQLGLTSF
ncbi:hypothetical protein ACFVXG_37915 [Kitasatospora sp. NPDC058162]|uniref:hypothetical protein n=1 Tax=Kitasatospora sp. NPDC058162 TaxID=3346362 RepID=UPI0036DA1D62